MSNRSDDTDAPYLPDRYKQQVRAKKQRRIYKKLTTAGLVIVVFIVAIFLIISMLPPASPSTPVQNPVTPGQTMVEQTPHPTGNVTAAVTPGIIMGTGISALQSPDMLSLDNAKAFLHQEYPVETYRIASANLTDRYNDHVLYEFTILPTVSSSTETRSTVFIDAGSGDPYTPGQENARITATKAQDLAREAVPGIQPDNMRVRYQDNSNYGQVWNFVFVQDNAPVITGSMDAETGMISSFSRVVKKWARPAEPVIDRSAAQAIAERFIADKNGPVAVNMTAGQYIPMGSPSDPVAGKYGFIFSRTVNKFPCDVEGFVIDVDSVNGEITAYERHWSAPDNAFSVMSEPFVLKREATFAVLQQAKETYPESADGLRIESAEIAWKDQQTSGITPRPGSIPLAWKVVFTDDIIRANRSAQPAVAWVDAQTGSILDFVYQH
ncbi:MAG: hypothetical protein Q7J03_04025 [Methanoregula sp.]|nr:hypothetical protein [Methanoregula sp.]